MGVREEMVVQFLVDSGCMSFEQNDFDINVPESVVETSVVVFEIVDFFILVLEKSKDFWPFFLGRIYANLDISFAANLKSS